MRESLKKRISLILCITMIFTLIPMSSVPAGAEEVDGTAEMNALTALGIDTEDAPEGFDPISTSNPYGKDHVTLNVVSEVLLTGSDKETAAETTTSSTITGIPNNEDDEASIKTTTVSTITSYYIKSTLYGDGYKTTGGNVKDLFATTKDELKKTVIGTEEYLDITTTEKHTSPSAITTTTSTSITVLEPEDMTVVAASATAKGNFNGNEEGRKSQVVMVSTNKLAPDGGLYLSFGEYSDSQDQNYGYFGAPKVILNTSQPIGNKSATISEDFENNPYMMQNYLKVSAGDYDNDGTDEVAVFVPSMGNSRIEIYKLKTKSISSDSLEYFGNPDNWDIIWTYPLSEVNYVSNMVSLTSEDFNEDGVDDLAIAWGYYYGPNDKKGGTAAVLFGSKSSMLQESTSFPLMYGDSDIVRAAFIYGDIIGDGSGQLILGGQLNSDIENKNLNTRFIAIYDWDGTTFKQTMSKNYDLYEQSTAAGQTTYKYSNLGISSSYKFLSKPYCVANMAAISRGLSEPAMLYFDSLQFTYGDDGLSLTGVLDKKNNTTYDYAEYGAQSGDLIGLGYDTLFTMQCELPRFKNLIVDPSNLEQWIRYILYGEMPTTEIPVPAATYFNVLDYNKDSTFTKRERVNHSTALCLPNTDMDTSLLKYTGIHYFRYTDPKVLAVLASPPYFKDLIGRDDLSGSYAESETSYSSSEGSSDGVIGHASINAGVYASMEQDISILGVKFGSAEAELAFHAEFTWETRYTTELNQSIEYTATPGEDVVALYSIPMEIYEYEATMLDSDTGKFVTQVMSVNIPHTAAVTVMPVDKYNKIAENFEILDVIDKSILKHTLGDPSSYPSSADEYTGAVEYDGDWSAVGYTSAEGGSSIKQEIEMSTQWENSFELSVGMDYKSGAGVGGVITGYTIGGEVGAGYVMVSTEGSTFSGTLQSMPAEAEEFGYYHAWKVFYYKHHKNDIRYPFVSFPVVSYLVTDVSAPPPLPEDFEQDIKKTTDKQIALKWSYDKVVSGFQIYRYYEFPDGAGSYELPFVSMKDGVYDSTTGKWNFEFIDTGLAPYSDYSYQIQTVRSYVPVRSIKSEIETFRTKSNVGYPQLSLFSSTDTDFNSEVDSRSLNIFPDSTSTVYAVVANKSDYPEGVNYQWQKNENGKWTDILGKNSNYITFSGSGESDEGIYRCRTNVIYFDEARGDRYYISSYTESFATNYSKREPMVSDNGGFTISVDSGNIPIISLTLESANMNHRAAPTGSVVFNINGANYSKSYTVELEAGETRYSTAVLDRNIKNSAGLSIVTDLPEGVYEITADYSGSRVFKSLSIDNDEAITLLVGDGGYRLTLNKDGKAVTVFNYGDEINSRLLQYSKVDGVTVSSEVTDSITYKIMKDASLGTWVEINENSSGIYGTPPVGSYRMLAVSTSNEELAYRDFVVTKKPVSIELTGVKTSATGEVENYLPLLSLSESSTLAFDETLSDLGLYIKYINTAGNEVTMGDTSYSVTSIINGEKVTQPISRGTPPGSYMMVGTPTSSQTDLQKSTYANYNITFIPDSYIITGTKYEVKLTPIPVEGRSAGTLDIIYPQVVSATYGAGTSLTVLATPYSGYAVKQWTARVIGAGNIVKTQIGGNTFSYTMKDEPIEILVEFKIPDNTLTVSASPSAGGTVTWDDTYFTNGAKVTKDANIVFTAIPTAGLYHFVKWQKVYGGLTTDIYNQTYNFTMGDSPTMLYAIFERDSYKLTLGNNLTSYYMYDHDGNSRTEMIKKYISSGASVVGDTLVTVEPKVGYQIKPGATWKADNVDTFSTSSSYSFTMLKDTRIDVETELLSFNIGYKLTEPASSGNNVAITVNGATTLPEQLTGIEGGSKLVFSSQPSYGYIFKEWNVTLWPSTSEEKTTTYTDPVLTIDALGANINVEAVFIDNTKYVINAEINSGKTHGKLSYRLNNGPEKDVQNSTINVFEGDSVKLIAQPNDSFMVDKWYIDGSVLSTPAKEYVLENVDASHVIKVDLKAKAYYQVDFSVNDTALGEISAMSDGITFNSGNSDMGGGSQLVFTAVPKAGCMVESWTVNNNIITNKYGGRFIENVLSFLLVENCNVVVNYVPIKSYTVTDISPNAEIISTYNYKTPEGNPWDGATGTFTINSDNNYRITGVNVSGSTVSELKASADKNGSWTLVIGSFTSNTTITVETKPVYQVTSIALNGTINCLDNAVEGEEVILSSKADSGYRFSSWSVTYALSDEIKSIEVTDNKFIMPAANVTVSAIFEKTPDGFLGGGGGGFIMPAEILIEDIQLKDNMAIVTLTDTKNIISEEANLKIIELNKSISIIIQGNGLKITIPKGTLKPGDDVNDMVPEETVFAGDGWIVSYIDRLGNIKIVPWSVYSDSLLTFIAQEGGRYEVINNIQSFDDISGHWGEEAINFITARKLFMGTGENKFSPNISMNRAMLVTVLHRLDGLHKEQGESFVDVPASQWYTDAVAWAVSNNIVSGYGKGIFGPDDSITREQLATILYRYAKYMGLDMKNEGTLDRFNDKNVISGYSIEPMSWAVEKGLITGLPGDLLNPSGRATRAEVSAILMRFIYMVTK